MYSGVQTNEQIGLDPHQLCDQPRGCLWRDSSQNAVKCPHKIAACELIALGLCTACSLHMYQFPKGDSRQKHTYDNTLCSENTHDKSSVLSCHFRTLHHMPSDVGEFGPGEALHVDVNLTTVHTLVRF